jgi:hypothetical protein
MKHSLSRLCAVVVMAMVAWFGIVGGPVLGEQTQQDQRGITVLPRVAPGSVPIAGEYRALIIGIDKYKHVPPLATAVKDAVAVRDVLIGRYGFRRDRIMELLNEQATRTSIEDALFKLGQEAGAEDSVLIYYAGHGQTDTEKLRGWWVPVEGKEKSPGTFITNASIRDAIAAMKAKHVYLVADSCFSGTLFAKSRSLPPLNDKFFARLYQNKSRWGLTSGMNEPVADQGKDGHSIFAYFLLKLLRENEEPYLVPSHIYAQLGPLVGRNADQVPQSEPIQGAGDEGGQFVLRLAAGAAGKSGVGGSGAVKPETGVSAALSKAEQELKTLEAQELQIEEQNKLAAVRQQIEEKKRNIEEARRQAAAPPQLSAKAGAAPTPDLRRDGLGDPEPRLSERAEAKQWMTQMLDRARHASRDEWPGQRRQMLETLKRRMKEHGEVDPQAGRRVLTAFEKTLEEARAMPDGKYQNLKPRLVTRMMQAVAGAMGRPPGGGDVLPGESVESGPAQKRPFR